MRRHQQEHVHKEREVAIGGLGKVCTLRFYVSATLFTSILTNENRVPPFLLSELLPK